MRSFNYVVVFCMLILFCGMIGCANIRPSHIHNPELEKTANEALEEFNLVSAETSSIFDDMLNNTQYLKTEEDDLLLKFRSNYKTAIVTKLPTYTWEALSARITRKSKENVEIKNEIIEKIGEYLKEKEGLTLENTDVKEVIKKLNGEIEKRKKEVNFRNAMVSLFLEAFNSLPDAVDQLDKESKGTEAIETAAGGSIATREISFMNADNNMGTTTVRKLILEKIESDVTTNNKNKLDKDGNYKRWVVDFSKAEKLTGGSAVALKILNMGLKLSELEKNKAVASLERLNTRKLLLEDSLAFCVTAKALLEDLERIPNALEGKARFDKEFKEEFSNPEEREKILGAIKELFNADVVGNRTPEEKTENLLNLIKRSINHGKAFINDREYASQMYIFLSINTKDLDNKMTELINEIINAKIFDGPSDNPLIKQHKTQIAKTILQIKNIKEIDDTYSIIDKSNEIATIARIISDYIMADILISNLVSTFDYEISYLGHLDSIHVSRINAEMWQSIVKEGLSTLAQYHSGGFSSEDAANILRIAQTIALTILASDID